MLLIRQIIDGLLIQSFPILLLDLMVNAYNLLLKALLSLSSLDFVHVLVWSNNDIASALLQVPFIISIDAVQDAWMVFLSVIRKLVYLLRRWLINRTIVNVHLDIVYLVSPLQFLKHISCQTKLPLCTLSEPSFGSLHTSTGVSCHPPSQV